MQLQLPTQVNPRQPRQTDLPMGPPQNTGLCQLLLAILCFPPKWKILSRFLRRTAPFSPHMALTDFAQDSGSTALPGAASLVLGKSSLSITSKL